MELGKRKEMILAAIVEQYIKTGEPIGSKYLMTALPISVSSATIRNEMSELAELGFLDQPHTSAGRIPSQQGYRYYIDHLMPKSELDEEERQMFRQRSRTVPRWRPHRPMRAQRYAALRLFPSVRGSR